MKVQVEGSLISHLTITDYISGVVADMDGVTDRLTDISFHFGGHDVVRPAGFGYDGLPETWEWAFDSMRFPTIWCLYMDSH